MNLQTTKPRARLIRQHAGVVVWGDGGRLMERVLWRVTFPDSPIGYVGSTVEKAVGVAYRCRLVRISSPRHVELMREGS